MTALMASFIMVLLAEMGDKTQLLAMAFATRYASGKVLLGVFIATILNHGLAVIIGHFLAAVIPMDIISFIAALSFVGFGLWTIRGDELHGEDKKPARYGPIITVAIAFFLAEMGDKTQLATVSLAVQYKSMLAVLMGTTLGMIAADSFGIVVGIIMHKHIPEKALKWFSAAVFVLFGLNGMFSALSQKMNILETWSILIVTAAAAGIAARVIARKKSKCL